MTAERQTPKHGPCSATTGDMEPAIHGLKGIFWTLNLLVVQDIAKEFTGENERRNAIAELIVAGGIITEDLSERF